jgi:uncharacterized membrane protein YeaQ/YmgE (transglycosylase-associated protein family)
MGIVLWIIFGALAGWIASMLMKSDGRQGWLGNIIVGIIGAIVGGWVLSLLLPGQVAVTGFNLTSLIVAIIGSVIVLFVYNMLTGRKAV